MSDEVVRPSQQEPWAIRVAGDEGRRKAGENLRQWAGDDRSSARRFFDRLTAKDEKDPKLAGLLGEELVGKELAKLDERWTVVHGVRVGQKADVDHLVIGPGGVFCLNTKRIAFDSDVLVGARQFRVNGYSRDYYPKAVKEACRVEVRLQAAVGWPVTVRPVLVLVNLDRRRLTVKEQPADVSVVIRKRILRWLSEQPVTLTSQQAQLLAHKARHPGTWDPTKRDVVLDRTPPPPPVPVLPSPPPAPVVPPLDAATAPPSAVEKRARSTGITLARWQRYGHDRLYLNCAATGKRLGWRDEKTGEVHIEATDRTAAVLAALAEADAPGSSSSAN